MNIINNEKLNNVNFLIRKSSSDVKLAIYVTIFACISEIASISLIAPIISFMVGVKSDKFAKFSNLLGIEDNISPAVLLGVFLFIFIVATILRSLMVYIQSSVAKKVGIIISEEIVDKIISTKFDYITRYKEESVKSMLLSKMDDMVAKTIYAYISLISSLILSIILAVFILTIDYKTFFICGSSIVFFFYITSRYVKKRLTTASNLLSKKRNDLNKILHEIYSSLKRYIVGDYSDSMHSSVVNMQKTALEMQSNILIYSAIPRYLIEAVGLIVILIYFYVLNESGVSGDEILGIMVTFVFSFQRLLPAVNGVYFSWSNIVGTHKQTEEIVDFLKFTDKHKITRLNSIVKFKSIYFRNISYIVDGIEKKIDEISIKLGEIRFISGNSGSGKTTLIDQLSGLSHKSHFDLYFDGVKISNDIQELLMSVTYYIPQNNFIIADDIQGYIVGDKKYCSELFKMAIEASSLGDFNMTTGGMSGGQRQRVALARALYQDKPVVILDEALNAIEQSLERKIYQNLVELYPNKAFIVITHKQFDSIHNAKKTYI